MTTTIKERLILLRQKMQLTYIDFYLITATDAHNSEYLPECLQHRVWISGFDGSAGEALISTADAYLSTDGRYFAQARHQLDPELYTLLEQNGCISAIEECLEQHAAGKTLAVDPKLISIKRMQQLQALMDKINGKLISLNFNLIEQIKEELGEKLTLPTAPAYYLAEKYTGQTLADKLAWFRGELKQQHLDYFVLNSLDEIAWLFNIRGNDIEYNPLVIAYAIVGVKQTTLFVEANKINTALSAVLLSNNINLLVYNEFYNYLNGLAGVVALDANSANYAMYQEASCASVKLINSPIVLKKALKNAQEIDGARAAHIKDAVAVINFLSYLAAHELNTLDEISAAKKITDYRSLQANFMGDSFATISGYGANSAIIHYHPTRQTNQILKNDNLYLLDSGGQYLEGTTDITRTVHLGIATKLQKRHYTKVLKGHLAISRAIFPHGTCGEHLDILARQELWSDFLNYRHGTGHGVGSFLCVHEGPQRISPALSNIALVPGMIISNEPGCYFDNQYGIRIENLCVVTAVSDQLAKDSAYGPFYQFENLTLVPYCKQLIDCSLLTEQEILQINQYYQRIRAQIMPLLDNPSQQWLECELNLSIKV